MRSIILVFALLLSPLTAAAQAQIMSYQDNDSCQGYYQEESVNVTVLSSKPNAIPGQIVHLFTRANNRNAYPIMNGRFILKIESASVGTSSVGQIISYVELPERFDLPANGYVTSTYIWKVPASIATGRYSVSARLLTNDKFYVGPSSESTYISIKGNAKPDISLSVPGNVSISQGAAPFNVTIRNNTANTITVPIIARAYSSAERVGTSTSLETANAVAVIPPNSSKQVTLKMDNANLPAHIVRTQALYNDTVVIADTSVSRESDALRPSIYMGGLSQFPSKDADNKAFVCVKNVDPHSSKGSTLSAKFSIVNSEGKIVSNAAAALPNRPTTGWTGEQAILSNISGIEDLTLNIDLYKDNIKIDSLSIPYSCDNKGGLVCPASKAASDKYLLYALMSVLGALIIAGGGIWLIKRNNDKMPKTPMQTRSNRAKLLIITLLIGGSLLTILSLAPQQASAADWRTNIKSYSAPTVSHWSNRLKYYLGRIESSFTWSYWDISNDHYVNHSQMMTNDVFYDDTHGDGGNSYSSDFSQPSWKIIYGLPLQHGVYIIDPNVTPVVGRNDSTPVNPVDYEQNPLSYGNQNCMLPYRDTDGNYYSIGARSGGAGMWAGNGPCPANENYEYGPYWAIPLGTHVGFYIHVGTDADTPSNNRYSDQTTEKLSGLFVDDLPVSPGSIGCVSDYYSNRDAVAPSIFPTYLPTCHNPIRDSVRNITGRIENPDITFSGMDNFDCEPLHADGTMECVAARLGTSTPVVHISDMGGKIYGATAYTVRDTGTISQGGGSITSYTQAVDSVSSTMTAMSQYYTNFMNNPTMFYEFSGFYFDDMNYVDTTGFASTTSGGGFILPGRDISPFGAIQIYKTSIAPNAPVVTVVQPGSTSNNYVFSITGTDPDAEVAGNDTAYFGAGVNYLVDWDMDGVSDETVTGGSAYNYAQDPGTGEWTWDINFDQSGCSASELAAQEGYDPYGCTFVDSGHPLKTSHLWADTGTSTFQVATQDDTYLVSAWTVVRQSVPEGVSAPQNLVATTSASCGGKVQLNWNSLSTADSYRIYRYNPDNYTYEYAGATTSTSYIDTIPGSLSSYLEAGAPFTYKVSAYSAVYGESVQSDSATAQPSNLCNGLPTPANFTATTGTCGGKVNLSWGASSGATGYYVDKFDYGVGDYVQVANVTGTTYADNTGAVDETRYYRLKAHNNSGGTSFFTYASGFSSGTCVNCGNGICEAGETSASCPADCNSTPECSDTIDNDGNNLTDFPEDTQWCESADDDLEGDPGCTRGTITKNDQESYKFYSTSIASTTPGCDAYSKVLTCDQGKWKTSEGDEDNGTVYKFPFCRLNADVRER